jgi:hypothetical protein
LNSQNFSFPVLSFFAYEVSLIALSAMAKTSETESSSWSAAAPSWAGLAAVVLTD